MTPSNPGVAFATAAWVLCAYQPAAFAQCPTPTAHILTVDGQVEHKRSSAAVYVNAVPALEVCRGDSIRTGARSRATVIFADNTRLVIDQNTEWVVRDPRRERRTLIDLIKGAILFLTRQPRSLDVQTPFVNAATEGTEFLVRVESDRAVVTVFEGRVTLDNGGGTLTLGESESGVAREGRPPERLLVVRPRDGVRWAIHYPAVFPGDSFEALQKIPEPHDSAFYVRRAALLLDAGRLDEARADLTRAGELDPGNGDVYALRAIVAVALSDRPAALDDGREAVKRSPQSAAARMALSYALQANLELEAARDELQQLVAEHPDHAAGWARLAELWLALGYPARSREAARHAVTLAPEEARAHSVLGFAALAHVDLAGAQAAFERATTLDPGAPMARLGLGLTRIRRGQLSEGRRELEIAVALNPEDAILRSYLGKAYFDERREPLPGAEFERASQIDPLDPTPRYYDAIRKQTLNRPVEALDDIERSIALNDNRAVYRSHFFLDQDLAARSASLGRLYRDLGFEQRALVEAWSSIAADPGDYSGHRFLADTYSALPRHEIARVSELLQSQLLQPLNITPLPPRLAETDLFILEQAGPDELAFNEFNPLFNRNRLAVQASGVAGNHSVLGDELALAGIWNRVSFSVGQFHYDTDGFRLNNQQERDLANAFVQVQVSSATSVQAEYRWEDTDTGDLNLLFNPEDFSADQDVHVDARTWRLGMRHAFSPGSQLIASFYAGARDTSLISSVDQLDTTGTLSSVALTDSWTAEVRHLYRFGRWRISSGAGIFTSNRDRTETIDLEVPFPPFTISTVEMFRDDPSQTNLYVYSTLDLTRHVSLHLGASVDFYETQLFERNQFNPKAGVSWVPVPGTTIRAAAFRSLHRALVSSQTIEPTQVAGFNQFFAGIEGEDAWRYGIAVDQKFAGRLFAGLEIAWRDLTVPVEFSPETGTVVMRFDRQEQSARAYLYWAPDDRIAASTEYLYERFERDAAISGDENILELRTHRLPLSLRYFSPRGLSAEARATFVNQSGTFAGIAFDQTGSDRFWVVDAALRYRLPRRYGRLALEIRNLFDEEFRFQDTDPGNPIVKPSRLVAFTFTLGI